MFKPARHFVMIIGNGGATLSFINDGRVEKSWHIKEFDEKSLNIFAVILDENRRLSLTVMIDMLEQSYRREAIPPVNVMDRPKVLGRRLSIAFPANDIKAAVPLNEAVGQRGDLSYLFVSLPASPDLETWISFINGLANPIASLGLLPLESSRLATALAELQADEERPPAEWILLISRERTGGIRQIVVRRGKLAITRLTPPPPGQIGSMDLAKAISQEMTSTLTYLTRLGYAAGDHLDMIVIGSEAMRETIEAQQTPIRRTSLFTPNEAAAQLKIADIEVSQDDYGDLLHIAWAASKRKLVLEMAGHVLGHRRVQMVAARKWATGCLAVVALALSVYCGMLIIDILEKERWTQAEQILLGRLTVLLEDLNLQVETYPDRPKLMNTVLTHYDNLELRSVVLVPLLAGISDSLGPSIRLKKLLWTAEDKRGPGLSVNAKPEFDVELAVDLVAFSDSDQAIAETNALTERLQLHFTASEVSILRPPLDILPSQTLVGSNSEVPPSDQDKVVHSADISIKGKLE